MGQTVGSFKQSVKVERNKATGEVMGWDSLLKIINREDQSIMSDAKRIQSEIHHITSNTVYTVKEGN
jgi:hypothetical protein